MNKVNMARHICKVIVSYLAHAHSDPYLEFCYQMPTLSLAEEHKLRLYSIALRQLADLQVHGLLEIQKDRANEVTLTLLRFLHDPELQTPRSLTLPRATSFDTLDTYEPYATWSCDSDSESDSWTD